MQKYCYIEQVTQVRHLLLASLFSAKLFQYAQAVCKAKKKVQYATHEDDNGNLICKGYIPFEDNKSTSWLLTKLADLKLQNDVLLLVPYPMYVHSKYNEINQTSQMLMYNFSQLMSDFETSIAEEFIEEKCGYKTYTDILVNANFDKLKDGFHRNQFLRTALEKFVAQYDQIKPILIGEEGEVREEEMDNLQTTNTNLKFNRNAIQLNQSDVPSHHLQESGLCGLVSSSQQIQSSKQMQSNKQIQSNKLTQIKTDQMKPVESDQHSESHSYSGNHQQSEDAGDQFNNSQSLTPQKNPPHVPSLGQHTSTLQENLVMKQSKPINEQKNTEQKNDEKKDWQEEQSSFQQPNQLKTKQENYSNIKQEYSEVLQVNKDSSPFKRNETNLSIFGVKKHDPVLSRKENLDSLSQNISQLICLDSDEDDGEDENLSKNKQSSDSIQQQKQDVVSAVIGLIASDVNVNVNANANANPTTSGLLNTPMGNEDCLYLSDFNIERKGVKGADINRLTSYSKRQIVKVDANRPYVQLPKEESLIKTKLFLQQLEMLGVIAPTASQF